MRVEKSVMNIEVELVYVAAGIQHIERISLTGTQFSIRDVIIGSGCLIRYPELEDWERRIGIFGEQTSPDTIIKTGDRIEIYNDLKHDPKESRRKRVAEEIKALAREKSKPKKKGSFKQGREID